VSGEEPVRRGDVWWAELSGKRRPVVVVTNDALCRVLSRVSVVGITTTRREVPTEVELGAANGLAEGSVVNCLDLATLPADALSRRCGALDEAQRRALDAALLLALGLEEA
jgi:mRNA interferase MazF